MATNLYRDLIATVQLLKNKNDTINTLPNEPIAHTKQAVRRKSEWDDKTETETSNIRHDFTMKHHINDLFILLLILQITLINKIILQTL